MKIACVSDTHEHEPYVPACDVFIHAGDLTYNGDLGAIEEACEWISEIDAKHKLVIAGNHDFCFQDSRRELALKELDTYGITYLEDSAVEIDGIKFYGSPWTPEFYDWAFMLPRGEKINEKWKSIPEDTNVLITHGPPHGILDMTQDGRKAGCEMLLRRVQGLSNLKYHIFGHIHEGRGIHERPIPRPSELCFVNCATRDAHYNKVAGAFMLPLEVK